MRVLVTGGAGYIGSHTIVELLAQGHDVCVVDNFDNSSPVVLDRIRELTNRELTFHEADIRDTPKMTQILQEFGAEAVIHFAGLKAVGESEAEPLRYFDVNNGGTVSLLTAMDAAGCRRIVFSSSATVYGEPQYLPFDEKHPCQPTNVYGRTKYFAEEILRNWQAATPEASVVLLRYFNPVGAHASGRIGEDPRDIPNNLMPFVAQVAVGRRASLSVFGNDYDTHDGTGVRDYIHVVDLAHAHIAALDYAAGHQCTEAFNIGTGQGYSVLDMVAAFSRACGSDIPYKIEPRRPGDIATSLADPSRANAELGWRAAHDLDAMCASTWNWQSTNPQGYGEG
ncbi:UDP-glucose 4-epimerase GalE [Lutimaribacter sp. EGI FJ00015]|uniref:UDP-glucose 4-epimerase GalE n=1 Tax=Lutimaribacter degradans TaxID=2945989 RepID=A0ACC5ZW50_9RHOB|nr:UDP-glucose 4-epimerase GalE [Lutimaribacter sp. EGI FJ00013]MCM2561996.1 UDP-glucose 4-epimerase GalE [Lutimaribacter sp. EGI FJ00013]MCO0612972.1 UDP-glucose 4-epimerase GalE [Lutimaribacter sp. EGI FJ00015]MCO0635828.1 UDP-glucose 4-epimerase GalE [Lutimaribacter sp. EGI FJ00014]